MTTSSVDLSVARERIAENTVRRERDFAAYERWKDRAETAVWKRLGSAGVEQAFSTEMHGIDHDVVVADEVLDRRMVERRAHELIEGHTAVPKRLRNGEAKDNARSALFEALVASGHMSVVELKGDIETVHSDVMTRLLNSYYRDGIAQHERDRNFAEICEELRIQDTLQKVVDGEMPPGTKVVTISDFADPLGSEADKHGYRSANHKGMIRETSLAWKDGQWVRVIKQLSRSNAHAEQTYDILTAMHVPLAGSAQKLDVQLLSTQLLSVRYGAVEMMRLLDESGSTPVRFGEAIHGNSPRYDDVEHRSKEREAVMAVHIERLAAYEKELDNKLIAGEITQSQQHQRYMDKLREHIRAICIRFPEYTKDALGEAVVGDYQKAHEQYKQGDTGGASATAGEASGRESAVVVCGGASSANQADTTNADTTSSLQSLLEQAKTREKRWVGCPFCGEKQAFFGDPCDENMDCRTCGAYTRSGRVMYKGNGGKHDSGQPDSSEKDSPVKREEISRGGNAENVVKELFGERAILRLRVTIGGTALDVVDGRSKEVIARNVSFP